MKKTIILAALLAFLMIINSCFVSTVYASPNNGDTETTTINYVSQETDWTWSVPAAQVFDDDHLTKTGNVAISPVNNIIVLPYGTRIIVKVESENDFTLVNNDSQISYTLVDNNNIVSNHSKVLEYTAGTSTNTGVSKTLSFETTVNNISNATITGVHTDLLTFTLNILYFESEYSAQDFKEFVAIGDSSLKFRINNDGSISSLTNDSVTDTIPADFVTISGNNIVVAGTGTAYDGNYEIFDDGFLEFEGTPVAIATQLLVNGRLIIVHNNHIYECEGDYFSDETLRYAELLDNLRIMRQYIRDNNGTNLPDGFVYQLEMHDVDNFSLKLLYDAIVVEGFNSDPDAIAHVVGVNRYMDVSGGTAYWDMDDTTLKRISYHQASGVREESFYTFYKVIDGSYVKIPLDYGFSDGIYVLDEEYKYYYNGTEVSQEHIFCVNDYPFYYESGMTWNDWLNSAYGSNFYINDFDHKYLFIASEHLDNYINSENYIAARVSDDGSGVVYYLE